MPPNPRPSGEHSVDPVAMLFAKIDHLGDRMDTLHRDISTIKETQTDMITRLAVGQETIAAVKDLPVKVAVMESRSHDYDARIRSLEDDRKTFAWKIISMVLGVFTIAGLAIAYVMKAHP